jgi:hypothetical protein
LEKLEQELPSSLEVIADKLEFVLKRLFFGTSLIIIRGEWKSGKTDFSLLIAELLLSLGLVDKVASNIKTSDPRFEHITSMEKLRSWLFADRVKKLWIEDEVSEKLLSRKSMSKENISFQETLPQISKAGARMILIIHSRDIMDKTMFDPVFLKGEFEKFGDEYRPHLRKVARLVSRLFDDPITIENIPRTSVEFDPMERYVMTTMEEGTFEDLSFEGKYKFMFECARDFADVSNFAIVAKQKGVKPMTVKREIAKYIKWSMKRLIEERKDNGLKEGLG